MGVSTSPAQLAGKLRAAAAGVSAATPVATRAAATVAKTTILAGYSGRRNFSESWVDADVAGETARLSLRGGFAHLAEKGSYKKPGGYTIKPKGKALKFTKGDGGFAASAKHPGIPAHPAWSKGATAARPLVVETYETVALKGPINAVF